MIWMYYLMICLLLFLINVSRRKQLTTILTQIWRPSRSLKIGLNKRKILFFLVSKNKRKGKKKNVICPHRPVTIERMHTHKYGSRCSTIYKLSHLLLLLAFVFVTIYITTLTLQCHLLINIFSFVLLFSFCYRFSFYFYLFFSHNNGTTMIIFMIIIIIELKKKKIPCCVFV